MAWQPKHLTPAQLEERRLKAGRLLRRGRHSKAEIARLCGVTKTAVGQWAARLRHRNGLGALRRRKHPGRPPRLGGRQWKQVAAMVRRGATAWGFPTDRWTLPRVAKAIQRRFGVRYHPHYLAVPLHRMGFSPQVPKARARERDEELIQAWLRRDWPRIKRGLSEAGRPSSSWTRPASRSDLGWVEVGLQ